MASSNGLLWKTNHLLALNVGVSGWFESATVFGYLQGRNLTGIYCMYLTWSHTGKAKFITARDKNDFFKLNLKFCAEKTAVETLRSGSGQTESQGLLKILGPVKCQSTLNKRVRRDRKCVDRWAHLARLRYQRVPGFGNWASVYDGVKRDEKHLQHFRPTCVGCGLLQSLLLIVHNFNL